MPVNWYLVIVI